MAKLGPDLEEIESEREPPPAKEAVTVSTWIRKNLFASVGSTILTVVTAAIVIMVLRGVAGFIFGDRPKWGSITSNLKLYMVFAYPKAHFLRIWISLGVVVSLFGLTQAVWKGDTRLSVPEITSLPIKLGAGLAAFGLIAGPLPIAGGDSPISLRAEAILIVIGALLAGSASLVRRQFGANPDTSISRGAQLGSYLSLFVVGIWLIEVPKPTLDTDRNYLEPLEPLAGSTTEPLTVLAVVMIVSFVVGRLAVKTWGDSRLRGVMVALWILSYPTIVFVILRAPDVEWDRFWSRDIWLALGFIVVGGLLLPIITDPVKRERGRLIGVLVAVVMAAMFWPLGIGGLPRNLMVLAAITALAAPSFSGQGTNKRIIAIYVSTIVVGVFFMTAIDTSMSFQISKTSFMGGLVLTIVLAIGALALAFPLAVLAALGRQSSMPIFRQVSIGYIEIVRGVPLIVWLIMGVSLFGFFVPEEIELDETIRVLVAFTLFWGAYLAENVRGGLQAIGKGQVEAAQALGMSTVQTTTFIVLPQALRLVIPPIVGQVITSFKDTSLISIVGVFELLNVATAVPQQTDPFVFIGTSSENLLFVAMVYWIFTVTISRSSQRLESKLGVGTR